MSEYSKEFFIELDERIRKAKEEYRKTYNGKGRVAKPITEEKKEEQKLRQRIYERKYYAEHREEILKARREYDEEKKKKIYEYQREYYKKNKDKFKIKYTRIVECDRCGTELKTNAGYNACLKNHYNTKRCQKISAYIKQKLNGLGIATENEEGGVFETAEGGEEPKSTGTEAEEEGQGVENNEGAGCGHECVERSQ